MARADAPDQVELLLHRVGRWLGSDAPGQAAHPDNAEFAAYVEWLHAGAPGECPLPAVALHAGGCPECYRKAETLLTAHLQAARETYQAPVSTFLLCLAERLEHSYAEWTDRVGNRVREALLPAATRAWPATVREVRPPPSDGGGEGRWVIPSGAALITAVAQRAGDAYEVRLRARHAESGRPLAGALVRLLDQDGAVIHSAPADDEGKAVLTGVAPREYRVDVAQGE